MPPNPDLPVKPLGRRFSQYYVPVPVYIGLDVEPDLEHGKCGYAISVHDGSYTTDYYSGTFEVDCKGKCKEHCMFDGVNKLLEVVRVFAMAQHYKVQIIAISRSLSEAIYHAQPAEGPSAASMFWRELDAIPFHVTTNAESSDEMASAAVRKAVMWLSPQYPGNLPRISVGYRHEVEVDFNGLIRLVDLIDYKRTVCSDTWRVIMDMVTQYKDRKLRLCFFNSTPQGGGVALMRHALLRLYRLLGVEVHWYVARPKPEVFDITKRKFHNVLQGVAPPDVRLNDRDKQMFIDWSDDNAERFWLKPGGPIGNSDVIVIDDPQLVGVIPHIKKHAPKTRIIFRSHIEMRADLIREFPDGPQAETWNFLWQFIQQADLFVSHPMENFVPDVVPRRDVVQMPATTDALDGLNKRIDAWSTEYYQSVFNRCCMDQGSNEVDWSRPYIVQVARFDPSKGIPDVLESYRLLRQKLADAGVDEYDAPQLVICGHGSIDDPDGTVIYEDTYRILHKADFTDISPDIIVARLPPSDQLLDMVLSNAKVALQLSHREGFEVKVTEALHKGIPIVAYEAGGIPLQIVKDHDGFLLPIGDVEGVADRMFQLVTNAQLHRDMSNQAKALVTEEFFTVWNAIGWLHLCLELTNEVGLDGESKGMADEEGTLKRNSGLGNNVKVSDHWRKKYNYAPSTTTAPPRI